jgi:GNAT superfamily N-acetyltransferase
VGVLVERVTELSGDRVGPLVAESETAGLGFVRRLAEEWTGGENRFDRPGEALFEASIEGRLIGLCGLNIDPYTAEPRVGRVRHLYVLSAHRQRGIGRQLVEAVIGAARGPFDRLRLRTGNPAAARLYEGLGFHRSIGAGDCTHHLELDAGGTR